MRTLIIIHMLIMYLVIYLHNRLLPWIFSTNIQGDLNLILYMQTLYNTM